MVSANVKRYRATSDSIS
uniref:Uncharacterized protein n=1 Tax=Anguilla anguilla TaxID=7936 RepID=A0A0E9QB49_ANGAN